LELRQLRYFLAVADSGSLSRAASEVFIAQSALSKQIAELEHELGVKLLQRSRTGVTVTEAGKTFYAYARAILKQVGDVKSAVLSSPHSVVGSVVLCLPQSVSAALALPLIRAARERLPNVALNFNEELSGNVLEQLRQGRVDLAVFTPTPEYSDVVYQPFVEEEFYLLHGIEGAAAELPVGSDVDLATVASQKLTMPSQQHNQCMRLQVAAAVGRTLNVVMEINSAHILKSAIEAGIAASVMPYAVAADEIAAGRLRAHRTRPNPIVRTLGVCHSSHIPLTNAKKAVSELVQSVARQLCEEGKWVGATYIRP
jgi:LysR family transcriptional regulator, nitrogen assimilation regulatory protein